LQQSAEEAAGLKLKVVELESQCTGIEEARKKLEIAEAERDRWSFECQSICMSKFMILVTMNFNYFRTACLSSLYLVQQ
jgi:hypothetical protein